jgi:hypothetical protein
MIWRGLWLLLLLMAAGRPVPARACSLTGDYVRPSNFELVQIADAITVATPESAVGGGAFRQLSLRTGAKVKGTPPERVRLFMGGLGNTIPSDLTDLSRSHPEGHAGPCNRTTFARGGRYLLFLEHGPDGEWKLLDYPFSRVNEDYAGENNSWMRAVRRYHRLQQSLAPMDQLKALARMAETGRDTHGGTLSPGERADIVDHLRSISPWKPTAHLLDLYERIERGQPLPFGTRPHADNGEAGNIDAVVAAALGEPAKEPPQGAEGERLMVLSALATGDHPVALPLIQRLWSAPATGAQARGLILRYLAKNRQYGRAYQWIETRLMAELPLLRAADAVALLTAVAEVQRGEPYEEGKERWRSDPRAAATWPKLALALYWYQVRTIGEERALHFGDAIAAIPITDYRAQEALTLALAADYDEKVGLWALAELARPPPPEEAGTADDEEEQDEVEKGPELLPLRILASAWSEESEPHLADAFCRGGNRRRLAIVALGRWGDTLYEPLLARMAATPGLSDKEKSWLFRAAADMAGRELQGRGNAAYLDEDEDKWLVTRLARGQWGSIPVVCSVSP